MLTSEGANLFLLPGAGEDYVKDQVKDQVLLIHIHPRVATITNSIGWT